MCKYVRQLTDPGKRGTSVRVVTPLVTARGALSLTTCHVAANNDVGPGTQIREPRVCKKSERQQVTRRPERTCNLSKNLREIIPRLGNKCLRVAHMRTGEELRCVYNSADISERVNDGKYVTALPIGLVVVPPGGSNPASPPFCSVPSRSSSFTAKLCHFARASHSPVSFRRRLLPTATLSQSLAGQME